MEAARIRGPSEADLPFLVDVYNHYVTTSHVTFDIEPFSPEQRRAWLEGFSQSGPRRLLVAEFDRRPVGYASSTAFRPKAAYRTSVETTIYLDPEHTRRGTGLRLYSALLEALREEDGVHRAYGGIALPNPGSVALHEKLGFSLVGTFREVGHKFGKYWSVSWYEKDCSGLDAS